MNNGSKNLIKLVSKIPDKVHAVTFMWQCFQCKGQVQVSAQVFRMLERKELLGVKCASCLEPPGKGASLEIAA